MSESYDDRYCNSETSTRFMKHRVSDSAPTLDSDDDSSRIKNLFTKPAFWTSVVAGGAAGVVVDFTLYPLDTIKTRHQSEKGFMASGGFRKLYKGILPVVICSAPVSALFFCIYNSVINCLRTENSSLNPLIYVVAASAAELVCSSVRVPLEIVKQRKQTSNAHSYFIIKKAIQKEGFLGLYRGFSSTIAREIPFSCIQFPLWEYMINELIIYQNGEPLTALQTAYCGAIAGAAAGIITTPVDVVKTRIMLAEREKIESYKPKVYQNFMKEIYFEQKIKGFFSGVVPRALWIMLGGFIYFGAYEKAKLICEQRWCFFKNTVEKLKYWAPWCFKGKLGKLLEEYTCPGHKDEKPVINGEMEEDRNLLSLMPQMEDSTTLLKQSEPPTLSQVVETTPVLVLADEPLHLKGEHHLKDNAVIGVTGSEILQQADDILFHQPRDTTILEVTDGTTISKQTENTILSQETDNAVLQPCDPSSQSCESSE